MFVYFLSIYSFSLIFIYVFIDFPYIEDAMRRDTAAPSVLGLGVSCSVSASGDCRFMLGVSFVDLA